MPIDNDFSYHIFSNRIQIIDSKTEEIVTVFEFSKISYIPNCVQEKRIIVSPNYRGKGFGQTAYKLLINKYKNILSDDQHTSGTRLVWNKLSKTFKIEGVIELNKVKNFEFEKILKNKEDKQFFSKLDLYEKELLINNLNEIKPIIEKLNGRIQNKILYFPLKTGINELENDILHIYNKFQLGVSLIMSR